jgi:hypothetical protein
MPHFEAQPWQTDVELLLLQRTTTQGMHTLFKNEPAMRHFVITIVLAVRVVRLIPDDFGFGLENATSISDPI